MFFCYTIYIMVIHTLTIIFVDFFLLKCSNNVSQIRRITYNFLFCPHKFILLFEKKKQQVANGILMATAAAIGLLCYFLGETKQRRAFLEAKQSLEVKMVIEEQSAEQVK